MKGKNNKFIGRTIVVISAICIIFYVFFVGDISVPSIIPTKTDLNLNFYLFIAWFSILWIVSGLLIVIYRKKIKPSNIMSEENNE